MERHVMSEGGIDGDDYLKFMAEESGNVAADGMFSIQVSSNAQRRHMRWRRMAVVTVQGCNSARREVGTDLVIPEGVFSEGVTRNLRFIFKQISDTCHTTVQS